MDEVLHPVKSRRLIERSAQHAYDLVERVVNRPRQTVVDRVALAVVRAGVRVLPSTKHLDVVDNSVADGRKTVWKSKFYGAFASSSTPSTRRLLDGVAMPVHHHSTEPAPDTRVDFHTDLDVDRRAHART